MGFRVVLVLSAAVLVIVIDARCGDGAHRGTTKYTNDTKRGSGVEGSR
jgi:hypothetical protein